MITLRQMQQFVAVAEEMSFHRAAARLNMAQPPLTIAIRALEQHLGVKLLVRGRHVSALTAAGEVFLDEARRTLSQAEHAEVLARKAAAGTVGFLRIGFVPSSARHLMPPLVVGFRERSPNIELELTEASTARQIAALIADKLDVGIINLPLPAGNERDIATRVLVENRLIAALPTSHPFGISDSLPLETLADCPWVMFPQAEAPELHSRIMMACTRAGFSPRIAQRAFQMETILGLVAAGLGVALVPSHFASVGFRGVAFCRVATQAIEYQIGLIWARSRMTPALELFLESSRKVILRPEPSPIDHKATPRWTGQGLALAKAPA